MLRAYLVICLMLPGATFAFCSADAVGPHSSPNGAKTVVTYPAPEADFDPRNSYFVSLLKLALERTVPEYGDYTLQPYSHVVLQNRAFRALNRGTVNVIWSMTTKERESEALPVRIPLMKGLIGYRVFLMNKALADKMQSVTNVDALKKVSLLQGHDWPDTQILNESGFKVRPVSSYGDMFHMLQGSRFALFPRGVLEAWGEISNPANKELTVEPRHMLVYPAAVYFFVANGNTCLEQRLAQGLEAVISDGSFSELLINHPSTRDAFSNIDFEHRLVHRLHNPLLPENTPVDVERYWFSFSSAASLDDALPN